MKLPKQIYVKWNEEGDEPYLEVSTDMELLADEVGGQVSVGCYELTMTGKLATRTEFAKDKLKAHR